MAASRSRSGAGRISLWLAVVGLDGAALGETKLGMPRLVPVGPRRAARGMALPGGVR